jgi:2-polyprenyl-3-methyl-5-hydroxy-6-metoxy-1,4-benzoquinol methylase
MLTRNEKLLKNIDPAHQVGVEIGALASPIVTRQMGQIRYVDHATTEALRLKYAHDPSIDIAKIVDVDYIWGEKRLEELTQAEAPFDYLIASHVIEHVPDLLGWLNEIRSILKPGGVLSLAIPDKRQCFDYNRQPTRLCEVLEAYLRQNRRPSSLQIFDFYASAVTTNKNEWVWSGTLEQGTTFKTSYTLSTAWEITKNTFTTNSYCDVHCWVFTPESFLDLLADMAELQLLKFEIIQFYPTEGCEFFVSLRAVEQAVERSAVQLPLKEDSPLHPTVVQTELYISEETHSQDNAGLVSRIKLMESTMQALQIHLAAKEEQIKAIESSKFWQLRTAWFKVKRKLGLPVK